MRRFLLDTNHASALMDGNQLVISRMAQHQTTGDTFGIPMTVIGELYYAVYASSKQIINATRLRQLMQQIPVYEYDMVAAEQFGLIRSEQKQKGKPIPTMDAQIAAIARSLDLTVLTYDKHFGYVSNLKMENWLLP